MIALIVCLINCWCLLLTGEGFIKSADGAFAAIVIEIVIEGFGVLIYLYNNINPSVRLHQTKKREPNKDDEDYIFLYELLKELF